MHFINLKENAMQNSSILTTQNNTVVIGNINNVSANINTSFNINNNITNNN